MNIEQARFNMIEQQIRPWHVSDATVLGLLSTVKREDFVPAAHKGLAFADLEIPLMGSGEEAIRLGHCMLEPRLDARMLQDLAVRPSDTVLEIGAGSGYMAALLAGLAQRVITVEINADLAAMARNNLRDAGIQNVDVRHADGATLTAADGSFDVIAMSGSVTEVPHSLLGLLKVGGRLGAIVGEDPIMRATIVTRTGDTTFSTVQSWDTLAPRLQNFPEPSRFKL
ncbi:MAG: protein-L-isoaspartate O-methyltransferase [Pseudomonadota bacterium]